MPQRKVDGPYRVRKAENGYEVVYATSDQVQSLLPRKVYSLRQTAYRSALGLNRKWNKGQEKGNTNV